MSWQLRFCSQLSPAFSFAIYQAIQLMCLSPVVRLPTGRRQPVQCPGILLLFRLLLLFLLLYPYPLVFPSSVPVPVPFPIFHFPARLWLNCQMCLGAVSPFHCPRSWPCASAFPPNRIKNKASEKQGKWRKPRGRGS